MTALASTTSNINSASSLMGAITTATTTAMTINAFPKQQTQSHIPSYHGSGSGVCGTGGGLEHYRQQQQRSNSFKQHQQHQHQRQYLQQQQQHQQQQQQQPSQLPQTLNQYTHSSNITSSTISPATTTASFNNYQGSIMGSNNRTSGGSNTGSGSSSATSSSPLSPPSVSYNINKDDTKLVNEMNKLYRKSPFMQKKLNGSSYNRYNASPGDESPKKESVLSSIGQSILRNLTTSPFSQKKNTSNVQPNQIDALWRMPTTQDVSVAFDTCDATITSPITTALTTTLNSDSPALQRKRFQVSADAKANTSAAKKTSVEMEKQESSKPSMIPLTKNEAQPQRVPGNHSPIVLQRFYHQQNQLREKEIERQQHYSNLYSKHSPSEGTNPFHTNFYQTTSLSATSSSPQQHNSHIPIASTSTLSSYSTSSQSSTQSSQCSQVGVSGVGGGDSYPPTQQGPRSLPLILNESNTNSPTSPATLGFGTKTTSPTSHLQYQPLPQQYLNSSTSPPYGSVGGGGGGGGDGVGSTVRNSRSPATSPETLSDSAVLSKTPQQMSGTPRMMNVTSPTVTKLSKLYNQRSGSVSASLANANTASAASKENNFKPETATSPTNGVTSENDNATGGERKAQLYYRTMSCGSSSSGNSQTTSPSTETFKASTEGGFQEGSSAAGFIRRYAATGGAGSNLNNSGPSSSLPSTHTPAHILANLDRRHRSPDPPPRYNRGQSPLLLRKNILELSGQPPGTSPMLNRRFVNASPPLPPPRRGSESVPGSPQHFRTRIHYTPEPQRRVYRTIDQ